MFERRGIGATTLHSLGMVRTPNPTECSWGTNLQRQSTVYAPPYPSPAIFWHRFSYPECALCKGIPCSARLCFVSSSRCAICPHNLVLCLVGRHHPRQERKERVVIQRKLTGTGSAFHHSVALTGCNVAQSML